MSKRQLLFPYLGISVVVIASALIGTGWNGKAVPGVLRCLRVADSVASPGEPRFLQHAAHAPALVLEEVTFVAVCGEPQVVTLPYASGDVFLRFELGAKSLLRGPSGAPFRKGQQVTITVSIDDERLTATPAFIATMEPGGLEFNPSAPPTLTMSYAHAAGDARALRGARMWRQARPGSSWEPVDGARHAGQAVEVEIPSFSRYALSY